MLKDVIISIKSLQNYGFEDQDGVEFTTDGYYMMEDGVACINYEETAVTGMEGTRTSLMISDEQVVVDRDGLITSRMVFTSGGKSSFQYGTPYGTANLGIDTREIHHSFDENGGHMELDYVVNMEHAVVTRNKFFISVKKMGDKTNG